MKDKHSEQRAEIERAVRVVGWDSFDKQECSVWGARAWIETPSSPQALGLFELHPALRHASGSDGSAPTRLRLLLPATHQYSQCLEKNIYSHAFMELSGCDMSKISELNIRRNFLGSAVSDISDVPGILIMSEHPPTWWGTRARSNTNMLRLLIAGAQILMLLCSSSNEAALTRRALSSSSNSVFRVHAHKTQLH